MHEVLTYARSLFSDILSSLLVQDDKAGGHGGGDIEMRPVLPVGGGGIDVIARHQN